MIIWRRWILGGASAHARDLAGRFVPGGASDPPPSSVRAAILGGSCDDIVGGDDASERFPSRVSHFCQNRHVSLYSFENAEGKTPGSLRQGCLQRERVSLRQICPHLVRVRLFRHISLHLAGVSLYVTSIPTWWGFLLASPLPLGEVRLFMAHISLCDISPQIRE